MALVDFDRILNENPQKKLNIMYDNLRKNYNTEDAKAYYEFYKEQPLSFIIENSRSIFGEIQFGLPFYESIISNPNLCLFHVLESEKEKVIEFVEKAHENDRILDEHMQMIDHLFETVTTACENMEAIAVVAGYTESLNPEDEYGKEISDALYEYTLHEDNLDEIQALMEEVKDETFLTYSPFVEAVTSDASIIHKRFDIILKESANTPDTCNQYALCIATLSVLNESPSYKLAVTNLHDYNIKIAFETMSDSDLREFEESLAVRKIDGLDSEYVSPVSAVNDLFFDIAENATPDEDDLYIRKNLYLREQATLEPLLNMLLYENSISKDPSTEKVRSHNFFKNPETTLEQALQEVSEKYATYMEEEDSKDSDDDEDDDSDPDEPEDPNEKDDHDDTNDDKDDVDEQKEKDKSSKK